MEDISIKYNRLDPSAKKEAINFIDFLLSRNKKKERTSLSGYKKKILRVSQWNDDEVAFIEKNQKLLRGWKPKDW